MLTARPIVRIKKFHTRLILLNHGTQHRFGGNAVFPHFHKKLQISPKIRIFLTGFPQSFLIFLHGEAKKLAGCFGAYSLTQARHTFKSRQIHGVQEQTQIRKHVFDMGSFRIFHPAVFFKTDTELVQLDFQMIRLIPRPKKHGYIRPLLRMQKLVYHAGGDTRLRYVAERTHNLHAYRVFLTAALRKQMLLIPDGRVFQNSVGNIQNRLNGAVIFFQTHNFTAGEKFRKFQNILHVRPAERINRLGVVADSHDRRIPAGQKTHEPSLHHVGILVFIHHDMAEAFMHALQKRRVLF